MIQANGELLKAASIAGQVGPDLEPDPIFLQRPIHSAIPLAVEASPSPCLFPCHSSLSR
jgi:hypothetical protein